MSTKKLRWGFTTGSAAAAGAKACILSLNCSQELQQVEIPLPAGDRLNIPLQGVQKLSDHCLASIRKDGGDDPDATHQASILIRVWFWPGQKQEILIQGGPGVGRITKPGLELPVGSWAINPVPRQQIESSVQEALLQTGLKGRVLVQIEVPRGQEIAQKTLNPRLGILGGISILGTRGTVKPFSRKSYQATIQAGLNIARAENQDTAALCTGGRSERMLQGHLTDLPQVCFVQIADFFAYSLRQAAKCGFRQLHYGCMFGKLVKAAQGRAYTHARKAAVDFDLLAAWCANQGLHPELVQEVQGANTARQVLEMLLNQEIGLEVLRDIASRARQQGLKYLGQEADLQVHLFDFQGGLLCSCPGK
ncbi:MAG: cobalt-precorrin-5B (C(1))-methyltransferase CbiD [Desulfohalobiaceae bacterium]